MNHSDSRFVELICASIRAGLHHVQVTQVKLVNLRDDVFEKGSWISVRHVQVSAVGGQSETHIACQWRVGTRCFSPRLSDCSDDFQQETGAVFDATAVLVGAFVRATVQKLHKETFDVRLCLHDSSNVCLHLLSIPLVIVCLFICLSVWWLVCICPCLLVCLYRSAWLTAHLKIWLAYLIVYC